MPDTHPDQDSFCDIDGLSVPVHRPEAVAGVQDLVRKARTAGEALYPVGGRTLVGLGLPPAKAGTALDLTGLANVIDYPARDMTVTVQAGITMAELQRLLAAENQRLPIDVPQSVRATLGGALAANVSGPRRFGFGTLRDYVIGISVVNDEGHEIKAGGRVVKNVAGYDLCKLYIGSLGTLGIVTQVTLKVLPRPEQHALVILHAPVGRLAALLDRLHQSRTSPCCLELLNPAAVQFLNETARVALPAPDWVLVAGFESNADAVQWQVQQLIVELQADDALEARVGPAAVSLWEALAETLAPTAAPFSFRAAVRPARCAEFCQFVAAASDTLLLQAQAGNGIVHAHVTGDTTREKVAALVTRGREWLASAGGSVVVYRCPSAWKDANLVWGSERGDLRLMRAIKDKLDPQKIFNPGRFVGGI